MDFRGEPKFEDMHPSWQDKKRLARRQTKATSKALRGGAAAAVTVAAAAAPLSLQPDLFKLPLEARGDGEGHEAVQ